MWRTVTHSQDPRFLVRGTALGSCDCCGKTRALRTVVYCGMDCDACAECRGEEDFECDNCIGMPDAPCYCAAVGFFAQLTPEQQKAALEYRGEDC